MKTIRLYLEYRRQGLRRAWHLANMNSIILPVIKGAAIGIALVAAFTAASRHAKAVDEAADNRVAAKLQSQAGMIAELSGIVTACTGERDGSIWINDEMHLCHAVRTGVRR